MKTRLPVRPIAAWGRTGKGGLGKTSSPPFRHRPEEAWSMSVSLGDRTLPWRAGGHGVAG